MCNTMGKGQIRDLTGQRFDKLVALSYELRPVKKGNTKTTCAYWTCICDCGKTHISRSSDLTSEKCKSCGCNRFIPPNKRLDRNQYLWEVLYTVYEGRNKKHGLDGMWDITLDHFKYICSRNCFYCDEGPSNNKGDYIKYGGVDLKYSSLDRLYADKPYCLSNVVPCCDTCNTAKASMTPEQWVNWLKRVNRVFMDTGKFKQILPREKAEMGVEKTFVLKQKAPPVEGGAS